MKMITILLSCIITISSCENESKIGSKNRSIDCNKYVELDYDKMTGKSYFSSKDFLKIVDKDSLSAIGISMLNGSSNNSTTLIIRVIGAGRCIDDDDKMNILFRDGTKLEIENDGKYNCKRLFTVYFGGAIKKEEQISLLINKEIETIRVWTSDGYVQNDFTMAQNSIFMNIFNCLQAQQN